MYNAQTLKNRIKLVCKNKGINAKQMLSDCSLGANAIQQINDNKGMASFSIAKIADYLNVSVDYLLGRTSFAENDFTPTEIQLISNYRELNADNREKTSDYINDLLENQKYREKETQDEIVTLQKLLEEYDAQEYTPVYTAASDGKPPKATMLTKEQRLKILEILNDK